MGNCTIREIHIHTNIQSLEQNKKVYVSESPSYTHLSHSLPSTSAMLFAAHPPPQSIALSND